MSHVPLPYPEELKPDEFIAALELLWAVLGLLAWSALPGDEGLLEFPGEHDDVTARQREQSEAGIPFSCQGKPKPFHCPVRPAPCSVWFLSEQTTPLPLLL